MLTYAKTASVDGQCHNPGHPDRPWSHYPNPVYSAAKWFERLELILDRVIYRRHNVVRREVGPSFVS